MTRKETGWCDQKKCKTCGKEFTILYPAIYRYWRYTNRGSSRHWFCSWGCMRAYDRNKKQTKETAEMKQREPTITVAREMIEYMEQGGDVKEFLRRKGYTNPEHQYQNIRNRLKDRDPELFRRLPDRRKGAQQKEKNREAAAGEEPEKEEAEDRVRVELVYDPSIAEEYRKEQAEKMYAKMKVYGGMEIRAEDPGKVQVAGLGGDAEEQEDEYTTTAVRHPILGEFYRDMKHGTIDWRSPEGEEISLTLDQWERLKTEIPRMMKRLGVE